MVVLRWHVDTQIPDWVQAQSDLLFPSAVGEFRTRSVLDKPFAEVAAALKLGKKISARAMRRTYQDLARAAEVKDIVTSSVSGHSTEKMQQRYSTVAQAEMRSGIAKIISLAGVRAAMEAKGVSWAARRAPRGGMHGDEMKNGQSALPS
jgi:integrase